MTMFDLTGKVAIVTGSTRGIGRAIAQAMMDCGARVVISSEDEADTARAATEMGALGIPCDVTDDAALGALVDGAAAALGGIDIVVCNAGITGRPAPFPPLIWTITPASWPSICAARWCCAIWPFRICGRGAAMRC
jgi:NAD(P)-dependent dehydrogenase (short-subunit alcohol dehydrogenase family)